MAIKERVKLILRWSERYTKTDMVYLAQGGFWLSFLAIIVSIISFIKIIILGIFLPQEIYGIYGYVIAVSSILIIFSLGGINTSIIKSIANNKEGVIISGLKTRIKWGLIGGLFSIFLSLWYIIQGNALLSLLFLTSGVFIPFFSSFNISLSYLQAKKRFKDLAKYEILANLFVLIFVLPAVILTNNILLIIFLFFSSQFLFYGILVKKIIKNLKNREEDNNAIIFGKHLSLINAILVLGENIDKVIIWKLLGPIEVAIYSFAQGPVYKINSFLPIAKLALPKLGERNIREIKGSIISKFKKLFIISIPSFLFLFITAPLIYSIFLPQYMDSVPYFRGFSIIILLSPFILIKSSLISGENKKELYLLNTIIPLGKIALFPILGFFFGMGGIVFSVVLARTIEGLLSLYLFKRI